MAIRFKYDATGVAIPQNASNRKYGQALVLQQKRFEDDQKLLAPQQQMFNRQRQGMQQQAANRQQLGQQQGMAGLNAGFGANMAPVNPAVFKHMAGPRRLSTRLKNAQANANAVPMDPAAFQGMAGRPDQMQEGMLAAQLQARERAGFEDARKAGEYDPVTAAKIQQTYADAIKTDLSKDLDAAQKAEWNAENNAKRSKLLENRNPNPSLVDHANNGLIYFDPRVGKNVDEFEPGVGMTTIDTINKKERVDPVLKTPEPTPQLPTSYEGYAEMDFEKSVKALAAKKEELRAKAEDSEDPYKDEDKLRTDAYAALKGDYDFTLSQMAAAKQQSQPATPPPEATPAPPTEMQNLEPSYNADGTTGQQMEKAIENTLYPQGARSGLDDSDQPQAATVTPDELKSRLGELQKVVANTETEIYNLTLRQTAADQSGNAEASAKLKSEIYNLVTVREQATKGISEAKAKIAEPPIKPGQSDSLRKLDIDKARLEENLASNKVQLDNIRNISPRDKFFNPIVGRIIDQANIYQERMGLTPESEVVEKQPLTNEQYLIRDRDETLKALEEINKKIAKESPAVVAKEAVLPVKPVPVPVSDSVAQPQPAVDLISEVNSTFESGTPEQKAMLRQKARSSDNANDLMTQVKAGNVDAEKTMALLEADLSPSDMVADAKIAAKKDGKAAMALINRQKTEGVLNDESYTEAIVANSGKTAKQNYELFSYGTGTNIGTQAVRQSAAINALWSEMGMYDSRSYVRAFQKEPTVDEVIAYVAKKDNMPRKDAEEYVYNQLLSRSYAKEVQQDFEGSLTMDRSQDREKKEAAKRDAWTSKKPNKTEKK